MVAGKITGSCLRLTVRRGRTAPGWRSCRPWYSIIGRVPWNCACLVGWCRINCYFCNLWPCSSPHWSFLLDPCTSGHCYLLLAAWRILKRLFRNGQSVRPPHLSKCGTRGGSRAPIAGPRSSLSAPWRLFIAFRSSYWLRQLTCIGWQKCHISKLAFLN